MFWRPGAPSKPPIYVAGFFSSASGVGQSARLFASALERGGIEVVRLDVGPSLGVPLDLPPIASRDDGRPGILVSHLNPPELLRWLSGDGARALSGRRHVGYWAWELPEAPKSWRQALAYVDEIWCPSTFTGMAISKLAGSKKPVRVSPHPVFITPRPPANRKAWGLTDGCCAVFASFDLRSTSARKNPIGTLDAYCRAVPSSDPDRSILICKIREAGVDPGTMAQLEEAARSRSDVRLFQSALTNDEMASLIASVDIVVSLHRAEGFGLVAAEAMWLGRAILSTGWSGVMDFLNSECAEIVDYQLVSIAAPEHDIYSAGVWAEPLIADATARLQHLIDDPQFRAARGMAARVRADAILAEDPWLARTFTMFAAGEADCDAFSRAARSFGDKLTRAW